MVGGLPAGVVTLLFTDVEGSTRLLQELGDGYGEALHEHRRRLRAAFAEHEGVEVDTQGDEEHPGAADVVRRPGLGARSDRPPAGGPSMPLADARRTGRSGQDQTRSRGRRSACRPLSARRPLHPARLRRLAGVPRAHARRGDPVRRRRSAQRLLGAGPAAGLPQRALDVARARQLRASRRGLRVSIRGDRARPARRAPDDLSRAAQRPERVGVRRRGPRAR